MKKQVLGWVVAGVVCGASGVCSADGTLADQVRQELQTVDRKPASPGDQSNETITVSSLVEQLSKSPEDAVDAINKANNKLSFAALMGGMGHTDHDADLEFATVIPPAYRMMLTDPRVTDGMVASDLTSYKRLAGLTERAGYTTLDGIKLYAQANGEFNAQMSLINYAQQQRLIDQNDQIIELLKQLAAKK